MQSRPINEDEAAAFERARPKGKFEHGSLTSHCPAGFSSHFSLLSRFFITFLSSPSINSLFLMDLFNQKIEELVDSNNILPCFLFGF